MEFSPTNDYHAHFCKKGKQHVLPLAFYCFVLNGGLRWSVCIEAYQTTVLVSQEQKPSTQLAPSPIKTSETVYYCAHIKNAVLLCLCASAYVTTVTHVVIVMCFTHKARYESCLRNCPPKSCRTFQAKLLINDLFTVSLKHFSQVLHIR